MGMIYVMKRVFGVVLGFVAFGVALVPNESHAEGASGAERCKPKEAAWDWKANGYAVAATGEAARESALAGALELGCPNAYRYLDAMKLACPSGCTPGVRTRACKPKVEPGCEVARYEDHKDQWLFVCRKAKGRAAAQECTPTAATAAPFYATCDVPIWATATLTCAAGLSDPPPDGTSPAPTCAPAP